jgi:hypothetical protein
MVNNVQRRLLLPIGQCLHEPTGKQRMASSATEIESRGAPKHLASRGVARRLGVASGLVVAAAYSIGSGRALDYDGSVTVGAFVRHGSLFGVFRTVYNFNNHPYFSFVEHVVWDLGGHSELWLRVAPIAFAATTVGILAAWVTSRLGRLAGLTAASVLACNPMFANLGRSVRGYSLMALGSLVATLLLIDWVGPASATTRRRSLLYSIALGVAIGTQFYAALVLGAHIVALVSMKRFDVAWRRRIEGADAIGVLPYAAMLRQLLIVARSRPGTLEARFPLDAARAILGQEYVAVALLAGLVVTAVVLSPTRCVAWPPAAVVGVSLLLIWLVLHPLDLYPRFLVWLVPAVAFGAGAAVARHPRLALVALVAVGLMIATQLSSWTRDPIASRQAAQLVEDSRARGETPCAAGYSGEVILGYTRKIRAVFTSTQLVRCDLLLADTDTPAAELRTLGCRFERETTLPGSSPIRVYSLRTPAAVRNECPN